MMERRVAGLLLAGGAGRRLGCDKAECLVGGHSLLDRALSALRPVADELIIVGGEHVRPDTRHVADERPGAGPLAAICTGMEAAAAGVYLVVACDMPFLNPGLLRGLLDACEGCDVVVPVVGGQDHPLCAAYARTCLAAIREALQAGERKMSSFFGQVLVRRIRRVEIARYGSPEMLLMNVNTPEDLAHAEQMVAEHGGSVPHGWPEAR